MLKHEYFAFLYNGIINIPKSISIEVNGIIICEPTKLYTKIAIIVAIPNCPIIF